MSKDIRSYFTPFGAGKKKEDRTNVQTKCDKKSKPQKKRIALISDSDDDDVPSPIKRHKTSNVDVSRKPKETSKETTVCPEPKAIKAIDVFGSDKIKRSEAKTSKEKKIEVKKPSKKMKVTSNKERNSDEEFEATLRQLDEIEARANEQFQKESPVSVEGNRYAAKIHEENPSSSHMSQKKTIHITETDRVSSTRTKSKAKEEKISISKVGRGSSHDLSEVANDNDKETASKESNNKLINGTYKSEDKDHHLAVKEKVKHSPTKSTKSPSIGSNNISGKREKIIKTGIQRGINYISDGDEGNDNGDGKSSVCNPDLKIKRNETVKKTKTISPSKDDDDKPSWADDPAEKRRLSAIGYQRYLEREGPKNLGSKEIPKGKPGCLTGLVFVITGVLDSIERDAAGSLIQECGGKVTASISRKTSFIVVGDDAGPSKVHKAQQLGTPQLNEDELFDLIRTKSGISLQEKRKVCTETPLKDDHKIKHPPKKESESKVKIESAKVNKSVCVEKNLNKDATNQSPSGNSNNPTAVVKVENFYRMSPNNAGEFKQKSSPHTTTLPSSLLWVDKYRPTSTKSIVGQQGPHSNVKKLFSWLENWHNNQFGGRKLVKPSPWARDDDGSFFKAALLSGPPGVGKTTTAHLVCQELGLDIVEFNASDTRSKRLLREEVSELLSNKSLTDYFKGTNQGKTTSKHVLLMDEVDGMAGNEDRGGMQELIQLIKNSKVPVLCMCNDVQHQKMRSLLGHCFDLRFCKPRVEQIKGAMQSVCFKEGVKIPPNVLTDMIVGSNQDIRQILHHLSLYAAKDVTQSDANEAVKITKHIKLGPWEVMKKVFSSEEHKTMSINDKSDLFFHDYNISPLFVQENYLSVMPDAAKTNVFKRLDLIAKAADSICMGDTVERSIRSNMMWSLLPVQAMFSSVIPGDLLEGQMTGQITFPTWLGKNSRRNKFDRLVQELHSHSRLSISGNKQSLNLEYLPRLREAITRPLIQNGNDGIPEAIDVMQSYHLLRTDIDSIMELSVWPGEQDPMSKVDSKVKAALTRTYNKDLVLPYSTVMGVSKKRSVAITMEGDEMEENEEEEEEDDNISADAMIKTKKRPAIKQESAAGPSSTKRSRKQEGSTGSKRGQVKGKK